MLPLKYLPSTQVGVLGGTWKDGEQVSQETSSDRIKECHAFWMTMTHFLSASNAMSSETLGGTAGFEAHDELAEALAAMKDPEKLKEFKESTVKSLDHIANPEKKGEEPVTTPPPQSTSVFVNSWTLIVVHRPPHPPLPLYPYRGSKLPH